MAIIDVMNNRYETDLVIFDKDGTLLDFSGTWINIIGELIEAIGRRTPMTPRLKKNIQDALGVYTETRIINGFGPLAMGTAEECNTLLAYCLFREGLRWDQAIEIIETAGSETFTGKARKHNLQASRGAIELLSTLKKKDISVAVATNDNTADAIDDMKTIGAENLVDLVIGADRVTRAKPAPDMVHLICETLNKKVEKSVFIGDTVMDALTGRNSGVMLTIGLAGTLPAEELLKHTDITISSLSDIN